MQNTAVISERDSITTIGALKAAGYKSRPVKSELRENLIAHMQKRESVFHGIIGYDETVIPDLERAILSRHNIILLGLRGQAKTRLARLMVNLLDEYIPVVAGSEINDDPCHPLSRSARDMIREAGDSTPITWLHRSERYTEKLATPDVSVADLIGDVDPIKAANLKLPYSDERVIHFGLVPRAHRGIFVINELPDLQPRIQVALFNILQEGDIQIRGFGIRFPLDLQFVFTANPEDYTNRGSIVTPLKDRIDSQILTHYPASIELSQKITRQEARLTETQKSKVVGNPLAAALVEQIAFEARKSEYVDEKSGVSARLTISAYENLVSAAERRCLVNGEAQSHLRMADFWGIIPSVTGKIELVYEGEQEGPAKVANILIGKAVRACFPQYFTDPENIKRDAKNNPYQEVVHWFSQANSLDIYNDMPAAEYCTALDAVPGLRNLVEAAHPGAAKDYTYFLMEFVLHGLAEYSLLSKHLLSTGGLQFGDLLRSMFSYNTDDNDDEQEDDDNDSYY